MVGKETSSKRAATSKESTTAVRQSAPAALPRPRAESESVSMTKRSESMRHSESTPSETEAATKTEPSSPRQSGCALSTAAADATARAARGDHGRVGGALQATAIVAARAENAASDSEEAAISAKPENDPPTDLPHTRARAAGAMAAATIGARGQSAKNSYAPPSQTRSKNSNSPRFAARAATKPPSLRSEISSINTTRAAPSSGGSRKTALRARARHAPDRYSSQSAPASSRNAVKAAAILVGSNSCAAS